MFRCDCHGKEFNEKKDKVGDFGVWRKRERKKGEKTQRTSR